MRLAKLKVSGFRSIKKAETLILDPRVTILIGANDHGKSNLLAAINCLNDENAISADDRNWDNQADPVEIEWHFLADNETLQKLAKFAPKPKATSSALGANETEAVSPVAAQLVAPASTEPTPSVPPQPAATTVALPTAAASPVPAPIPGVQPIPVATAQPAAATAVQPASTSASQLAVPTLENAEESTFPTNRQNEIVFRRDLATNKVQIVSLPVPVVPSSELDVLALRPRVELFESPGGNVIDQVTRDQLGTPNFEFMQGIFRLAGLWESREQIFAQNDTTSKQLKQASARLTKTLNDQWNQGKDLKWIFEHTGTNGDSIVVKIEDPAIEGRYTRPSLRSSGFRTYFLLSMIIYARSQSDPSNSHIYLFDEPGTYLHPSAQLDLQRSFETIADQAQLVYTTHSLFLISKNYPERNRVISKTRYGTKIDQKPFSKNWKSVRQSLGILLSNNFLIADKTLLVEGPSDTIYLLEALKKLKSAGEIDVDLNDLSIVDAGDSQNFVAMAKIMMAEGRSVVTMVDGDTGGKRLLQQLNQCCEAEKIKNKLQIHQLPENKSSEDVFADLVLLQNACKNAYSKLVEDGSRTGKDGLKINEAVSEITPTDGKTLGKTIEEVTKSWFATKDKISKLLIATLYEDEVESEKNMQPSKEALQEVKKLKDLLGLRGEKSQRSGVFEEVE